MIKDTKKISILVIEDNEGDFVLIEEYLLEKIENPVITQARNFKQASDFLQKNTDLPDVILLDLTLPDKQGEQLIIETFALAKARPVIILTGFSNIEFSIKSIALGIYDYLVKDELNATVLYKSIIYSIERKKNNEQITESEKKYSDLFYLSPQPMWVYQLDNLHIVQVYKAARKHYGYTETEFLNKTLLDIRPDWEIEKTLQLPGCVIFPRVSSTAP